MTTSTSPTAAPPAPATAPPSGFGPIMMTTAAWLSTVETVAALGAAVSIDPTDADVDPRLVAGLRAITDAAGLGPLDELAPPERAMVATRIEVVLREALDLLEQPARPPGWAFTDPVILDGWGRGSALVPGLIAGLTPDLADVTDFLDVGTGVGLLAVAATATWPGASVVGIDTWGPSLERAAANVAGAGLEPRIVLRTQDVGAVDDVDRFDCIWVPTFFLTEAALAAALPGLMAAARPGGWIVLGRFEPAPDPVAAATAAFKTLRNGGCDLTADAAEARLVAAGCESVESKRPGGPVPIGFTIGRRPAT